MNIYENHREYLLKPFSVKKLVSAIFPTTNQTDVTSNDDRINKLYGFARKVMIFFVNSRDF